MLVCMYCGETYDKSKVSFYEDNEWNQCPKNNCDGYLLDIDEEILPQIILLNNKGYSTQYCCQGHMDSSVTRLYILFENIYYFDDLPNGFVEEDTTGSRTCISFEPTSKNKRIKYNELTKARIDLYNWINQLEDISC